MATAGSPRTRHAIWGTISRVATGAVVGAVSGVLGTVCHLDSVTVGGAGWPVGLLLAVAMILAVDITFLSALPKASAALADAAGRALVVAAVLPRGPGGDVALMGGWASQVWILLAVLVPAFAGPPLATMTAIRRARSQRAATPAQTTTLR